MTVPDSSKLKILVGCDENMPTAPRANSGSLGTEYNFTAETDSGAPGEGVPSVSDGRGGRAAYVSQYITGLTWEWRRLRTKAVLGSGVVAAGMWPVTPIASSDDDFAIGGIFRWVDPYVQTGRYADPQVVFACGEIDSNHVPNQGISFIGDGTATPSAARVVVNVAGNPYHLDPAGSFTVTGSPASYYIEKDTWYRVTVRVFYNGSTGATYKAYIYDLDSGTTWTFEWTGTVITTDYNLLDTDLAGWEIGINRDGALPAITTPYAYVDECWWYDDGLTDEEAAGITVGGLSIPWAEPSYRSEDHDVRCAVAADRQDFPTPRQLHLGALVSRFPPEVRCQRARFHFEGFRPGRPWLIRDVQGLFDTAGPFNARRAYPFHIEDVNGGIYRTPGQLPSGAWEDARNVESTEVGVRRRRGYSILRDVDATYENGANAFYTFRNYSDALHVVYKVGTALFAELGGSVASISTGWALNELPVFLFLDDRAIILSASKRVSWRGNTDGVDSFGADSPASISAVAGVGGTLTGDYYYAATFYDPNTGDETAAVVTTVAVSPSGEKVTLTLPGLSAIPDSRFTYYRIYRTVDGGSAPSLLYIGQTAITAGASMTWDDTGEPDGTVLLGQVTDSDGTLLGYITMTLPDDFAIGCVHMERAFYSGGDVYPERIYVSEANEPQRFYDAFYLVADGGPVRALISWQHRLVAFTDTTVEFFESDWVRDADGNANVQRTVMSRSVGCLGPHAVVNVQGGLKWMDRRGIWENPANPTPIGDPQIQDLVPYVNHGISHKVVASFNHIRRQVWFSVPQARLQDDNTRFQTVYVQHIDRPERWTLYEMEASFHSKYDYDLQGLVFGVMDHLGVMKWFETFEGDGAEGDEDFTTEDAGTDDYGTSPAGILSVAGNLITVYGSPGWTTDALRGMGVGLYDRSTKVLYAYTIKSNTADSFTCERTVNAALAQGDGYYVGAMRSFVDYAPQEFGSPNEKIIRQLQTQFVDLGSDRYL